MTFPQDNPIFQLLHWLVNTPGVGGLGVIAVVAVSLGGCAAALRWIVQGGRAAENSTYAYPTSTLLHHNGGQKGRAV